MESVGFHGSILHKAEQIQANTQFDCVDVEIEIVYGWGYFEY